MARSLRGVIFSWNSRAEKSMMKTGDVYSRMAETDRGQYCREVK